jgi:uncharacterized protein
MMNFKRKAIFTAVLALVALMMVLVAGCQSTSGIKNGSNDSSANNNNATLDLNKTTAYGSDQSAGANGISVTGQGSVTMKPDVATITLGVETMDADSAKASKANDAAMTKVLAAVKGFGVTDEDITTTNFSIYPRYDEKGTKIVGYTVSNSINVKVKNLDKLGDVITAATSAGANSSYGISFDILDRTAAYNEALAQAMDKAKARAGIMAKACGVTLGKTLTISESSSYSGPVYAAAESLAGAKDAAVPVSSGQLDVTASVNVVYEIVK